MPRNGTVTLTCFSGSPVEWFSVHFNTQKRDIQDYTLTLYNLQEHHSGEYLCRGTHTNTHIFHAVTTIVVAGTVTRLNETFGISALFLG